MIDNNNKKNDNETRSLITENYDDNRQNNFQLSLFNSQLNK